MAGFQKFPTPRAVFGGYWSYHKKWKANSVATFASGVLITLAFSRFCFMKTVHQFNNIDRHSWLWYLFNI